MLTSIGMGLILCFVVLSIFGFWHNLANELRRDVSSKVDQLDRRLIELSQSVDQLREEVRRLAETVTDRY